MAEKWKANSLMQMPENLPAESQTELVVAGSVIATLLFVGIVLGTIFLIRQSRPDSISWRSRMSFLTRIPLPASPVMFLIGGLLLVFALLVLVVSSFQGLATGKWAFLLQSLSFHWFIIIFIAIWKVKGSWSWSEIFGFRPRGLPGNLWRGVLAYLMAMPIIFAVGYIYQMILIHFGYEPTQQPIMKYLAGDIPAWTRIYGVVLAILIAPVAEELLFRGLLLPLIARKLGVLGAVLGVSFIFAAMHLFIPALVPLFFISIAFSLAYVYTGSLATPIAFHSIFNTVNLAFFIALHDTLV